MHFSIPYTEELSDEANKKFSVFHIHVNGVRHCSVRFSQLFVLYDELRREQGANALPPFPPKRVFQLSGRQLEERRAALERFLQGLSSDAALCESRTVVDTLSRWRRGEEERLAPTASGHLDVWLLNGQKKTLEVLYTDRTSDVLEKFASRIQLSTEHVAFFALFLMRKEEDKEVTIVRKLQDFEWPYISLREANDKALHRIVIRKNFFDPAVEEELLQSGDTIALNLLYIQAVSDMERGWTYVADRAIERQLTSLQNKQSKKEYLRLARVQRFYGYVHLRPCVCDFPRPDSPVRAIAGKDEIVLQFAGPQGERREASFSITRIRTWRLVTPASSASSSSDSAPPGPGSPVMLPSEFHFEYLAASNSLRWVRLRCDSADQIVLLSCVLQAMVEEALARKRGDRPSSLVRRAAQDRADGSSSNSPKAAASASGRISLSSLGWRSSRNGAGGASLGSNAANNGHSAGAPPSNNLRVQHSARNTAFDDAIGDDDL